MYFEDVLPGMKEQGGFYKAYTATGASNAATLNRQAGTITTESLSTAAAAEETYTITNSKVSATSVVLVTVANGTNTTAAPSVASVTPAAGSFVVILSNNHASSALDGTLKINFVVLTP